ncbi:hypothetical protein P12x_005356 [Tundrisphaera lichenicola]|uniref:hypothetical protein n=1 Tax=Tundrisphaera lichenicola TaxID=2029860 RepID=UPI003EC11B89
MVDEFEGTYPVGNLEYFRNRWKAGLEESDINESYFNRSVKNHLETATLIARHFSYLSCWHENAGESAAMWKLYLKSNEGIAIKTTHSRLCGCLSYSRPISVSRVSYVDYRDVVVGDLSVDSLILLKRLSFKHEQEVRAYFVDHPSYGGSVRELRKLSKDNEIDGIQVKVCLRSLIEKIYVAPGVPWLYGLVESLVRNRFKLDVPVLPSDILNV